MRHQTRSIKSRLMFTPVTGLLPEGLGIATSRTDILHAANLGNNTIKKFASSGVGSVFADLPPIS